MEDKKKEVEEAKELLKDIIEGNWKTKYIMSSDSKNAYILLNYIQELEEKIVKAIKYIELECYEMKEDPYWKYNKLSQTKQVLYILNPNNKGENFYKVVD